MDVIGIPCFAAIRPNARTLAVNQGKGHDDASAQVSAIMEAVEFAVAETPQSLHITASMAELETDGRAWFLPERMLPRDYRVDRTSPLTWLEGHCLVSDAPVLVPLDSVAIAPNAVEALPFAQSSNGLGAGLAPVEAMAHAYCELLERDASTCWSLRSRAHCASTELDLDAIADQGVRACRARVVEAGMRLKLFDLTTDLGMPVIMALIWPGAAKSYFDVASGVCAHPSASRAAIGAIEEAAQTRISNIAGARDDIDPSEYALSLPPWLHDLVGTERTDGRPLPPAMPETAFAALPGRLPGRTVAVALSSGAGPTSVYRLISQDLEDRPTNVHWRPGTRALRAMTSP